MAISYLYPEYGTAYLLNIEGCCKCYYCEYSKC